MHQYVVERRGKSTIVIVPRKKKQTDVTFLADVYNADCSVTGTSWGAPSTPKYPIFPVFLETIFPRVKVMVGQEGKYAGYTQIMLVRIKTANSSMESKDNVNKKLALGASSSADAPYECAGFAGIPVHAKASQ
jgi:hypothetical protein